MAEMAPALRLRLLGGFELTLATKASIPFPARKPALLLAHLALRPGLPQSRERLAGLFWAEHGEAQARASLRQALAVMRRLLGPHESVIATPEPETLTVAAGGLATDVADFELCLAAGTAEGRARAVALYGGELLDGFRAREPLLEEWLMAERQQLRERALAAMGALLSDSVATGPSEAAVRLALRILALDPLQEAAHRALMRLHARQGRRGAALDRYRTLRDALARELGVAPEEETQRLYRQLRDPAPQLPTAVALLAPPREPVPAVAMPALLPPARAGEPPAVAVLPFVNLGDADQEYFADGLTEDLTVALAAWRWFQVIGSHSAFAYKGRAVAPGEIGRELGARYLVHGSVRRAGNCVRIVARLVDATSGRHVWAQRYDRELIDLFAVQDEITERMVVAIEPEIDRAERERASRKAPGNLDAWDLALQAQSHLNRFCAEQNREAFRLLGDSLELDPGSAYALSLLALCHYEAAILGFSEDRAGSLEATYGAAERATALDGGNWLARSTFGIAGMWTRRDFDRALVEVSRGAELNPSSTIARLFVSCVLEFGGRPADAICGLKDVVRLDPFSPLLPFAYADLAMSHLLVRELEPAVASARSAIRINPGHVRARQRLTAALGQLGRTDEARDALGELLRRQPDLSLEYLDTTYPFRLAEDRAYFLDGLRRAGWNG